MSRWLAVALMMVSTVAAGGAAATPGSWTGEVPALRLAVIGKYYRSAPLQAVHHGNTASAQVTSVRWRYVTTDAALTMVELCQGTHCVPLGVATGRSTGFSGGPLAEPFYFRAQLAAHARRPEQLSRLELIVNYR